MGSCLFRKCLGVARTLHQRLSADHARPPEVATDTPSRTIRVTLSSEPRCFRATARRLSAARCAASRPVSTSSSAPTRPTNFVGSMPVKKSRFVPNGSGGDASLIQSCSRRCSALIVRAALLAKVCTFEFAAAISLLKRLLTHARSLCANFSQEQVCCLLRLDPLVRASHFDRHIGYPYVHGLAVSGAAVLG
jgi:hypothetical protein